MSPQPVDTVSAIVANIGMRARRLCVGDIRPEELRAAGCFHGVTADVGGTEGRRGSGASRIPPRSAQSGIAAALGLVAFLLGAVAKHVRARVFYNLAFPIGYLALAVAGGVVVTRSSSGQA